MIALLLALAWADEPETSDSAMPEVRKEARMAYPRKDVYDAGVTRTCEAEVVLGDKGKPAEVSLLDCEEAIAERTLRRLRRWRWDKTAEPGTRFAMEVVYAPPVDGLTSAEPAYWRRLQDGSCFAHVLVARDGSARVERVSEEACRPAVGPVAATPEVLLAKKAPEVCQLTFVSNGGVATRIDDHRCDRRLPKHVRSLLEAWTFPTDDGRRLAWSLVVELSAAETVGAAEP